MKNKRKLNKLMSSVLVLIMTFCLIACGNTAPAIGEDVVVNGTEESTVENTEASTEIVESSDAEVTGEAEIEDGEVAGASGEEEPAVTASPVPTAEPTPTPTVELTPTPEPHVHEYVETVTRQPSCTEPGEKQLICQGCKDVKTEAIPAMGHDFVTQYTTVEHAAVGHVEITEQQVQVGVEKPGTNMSAVTVVQGSILLKKKENTVKRLAILIMLSLVPSSMIIQAPRFSRQKRFRIG